MNGELKELYEEDIRERQNDSLANIRVHDEERRKRTQELIAGGLLKTAEDYHHAALIFQHGETPGDYKKANELAQKAMEMGDERSKWLYAATLDRWLVSSGKPQKFGTQFKQNKSGEWHLIEPIDETVTDEERAKYNVPPLSKSLAVFKEKYNLN